MIKEFLSLLDLFGAQTLCINEISKIIIIDKYKKLILTTFKVVMPYLTSFNTCQKFTVMNHVSSLCKNHFSKNISYYIPFA